MEVLEKIQYRARKASLCIKLETKYIPGITEDLDIYQAFNSSLGVSCYGPTVQKAKESARREAQAILMENSGLVEKILANFENRKKIH